MTCYNCMYFTGSQDYGYCDQQDVYVAAEQAACDDFVDSYNEIVTKKEQPQHE